MPEQNKRTRSATRPIPEDLRRQFYLAIWDLAWSGHFYQPTLAASATSAFLSRFGSGSIVARRHGLTILWLTALAGRFNELAKLQVADVDGESVSLARSKGGKEHTLTVDRELLQCTAAWHKRVGLIAVGDSKASYRVREWAKAMLASPQLLPSSTGGRLNVNVFNRDVASPLGWLFGIKLSSHCFRDTACQEAMRLVKRDANLDVRAVQAFLGHSSVRTTEYYLRKQQTEQICLPLNFSGE